MPKNTSLKLLIIDDDESIVTAIKSSLDKRYEIQVANNGKTGLKLLTRFLPNLILVDYQMPEMNGMEFIKASKSIHPDIPIIVMTGYGNKDISFEFIKEGAYRYLEKPFDGEVLESLIQEGLAHYNFLQDNNALQNIVDIDKSFPEIVGNSKEMLAIFSLVSKVAATDVNVLIQGESGTGKELIAKVVHKKSTFSKGPFIAFNCAGFTESLIESELFGHEKGSFTGAEQTKPGRFELAENGTIFLDEIGELSLSMQVKLLRVLQEKKFERIGGTLTLEANIRIVAATNRNLRDMVSEKTFREDLYYRLSSFPIDLPPLRQRNKDVLLIADFLLKRLAKKLKKKAFFFTDDAKQKILAYSWKGNVRELENVVSRSLILLSDTATEIPASLLKLDMQDKDMVIEKAFMDALTESALVKDYAKYVYENLGRNKNNTASFLGITFRTLQSRLS